MIVFEKGWIVTSGKSLSPRHAISFTALELCGVHVHHCSVVFSPLRGSQTQYMKHCFAILCIFDSKSVAQPEKIFKSNSFFYWIQPETCTTPLIKSQIRPILKNTFSLFPQILLLCWQLTSYLLSSSTTLGNYLPLGTRGVVLSSFSRSQRFVEVTHLTTCAHVFHVP